VTCSVLRYQPEIGPDIRTPLVRYLSLPVVPTQLGFDPRLQFIHSSDATGAIEAVVRNPVRGPVNVAPSGTVSLSRILRIAGKPSVPIPHPLFGPALTQLGRQLDIGHTYSDAVQLLRFGRGVDNRRLREEIGYEPAFDALGAVRDFVEVAGGRSLASVPGPRTVADVLARR
jgi:UDP-glucose 4-epimerase